VLRLVPPGRGWPAVVLVLACAAAVLATVDGRPGGPPGQPPPSASATPSVPSGLENSRQQVMHTLNVLVRAGEPVGPLREITRRLLNVKDPWYFGIHQYDRTGDVFVAYQAIEVFDAVLGRDRWLTPQIRDRLLASARQDVAISLRDKTDSSRVPRLTAALRLFRALGASDGIGVSTQEIRAGCETGPDQPLSRLSAASELLDALGEPGCRWTPYARTLLRESRASLDRPEIDLRVALYTSSIADALEAVADTTPEAKVMLTELRAWIRDVLADRSNNLLVDLVDPSIIFLLTRALPPGEPVVLSKRLHDYLRFVLTVPWEHDRRGVQTIEPPG
jgi:hypothetical protein